MRAAAYSASGELADIHLAEMADPSLGPTDAIVRIEACALNHRDFWKLQCVRETAEDTFVGGAYVGGVGRGCG